MAVGAIFLLVLIVVAVAILGGALWAIAGHLRRRQLDPRGDLVEGAEPDQASEQRPEHVRVSPEQHRRFVPHR